MTIALCLLIALFFLELLLFISRIGKPREIITPVMAVGGVIEYLAVLGILLWVVLSL